MNDKNRKIAFEQEITKQIDQMDEKFDRSGWFYIIILISIVFISLALFMYMSNSVPDDQSGTLEEMNQQIQSLEERIQNLESQISGE